MSLSSVLSLGVLLSSRVMMPPATDFGLNSLMERGSFTVLSLAKTSIFVAVLTVVVVKSLLAVNGRAIASTLSGLGALIAASSMSGSKSVSTKSIIVASRIAGLVILSPISCSAFATSAGVKSEILTFCRG